MMLRRPRDGCSKPRGSPTTAAPQTLRRWLRVLTEPGRLSIPFTTGLLVGIGETLSRARRYVGMRFASRTRSSLSEVIAEGAGRPRCTSRCRNRGLPGDGCVAAGGPGDGIQAAEPVCLATNAGRWLRRGSTISGTTVDARPYPERPWPALDELAAVTAEAATTWCKAADRATTTYRRAAGSTRGCGDMWWRW